jgi:hypothetical protein
MACFDLMIYPYTSLFNFSQRLRPLSVGKIILKRSKNSEGGCGLNSAGRAYNSLAGSSEHGNESSGPIKGGFLIS